VGREQDVRTDQLYAKRRNQWANMLTHRSAVKMSVKATFRRKNMALFARDASWESRTLTIKFWQRNE
jgi:hypothetical protein